MASSPAAAFIRVVADKTRAFVGEQVTVTWYLYLAEPQNNFQTLRAAAPTASGPRRSRSTNPQGRLAFTRPSRGRAPYQVALLLQKALFPLAPGKLTVTPMEAEVAQVDFFGRPVGPAGSRPNRWSSRPMALPRRGPAARASTPANVGATSSASRRSHGGRRRRRRHSHGRRAGDGERPQRASSRALPPLPGWKSYEPKTDVAVDGAETSSGTKTVEWLLRPERPGRPPSRR